MKSCENSLLGQRYETFLRPPFTNVHKKLMCLTLAGLSSLDSSGVRPGAYPRVEYLKDASLGQALTSNIRLDWKGLLGTNILAKEPSLKVKAQYCWPPC
jgi:hypothetical protein